MKKTTEKKRRKSWLWLAGVLAILAVYIIWASVFAVVTIKPALADQTTVINVPSGTIAWPAYGQSAIGINNQVVQTNGPQKPVAMASTAKLITALCVLNKYPLTAGQTGPVISITPADVAIYNQYQAEDGSDLVIQNGEQLSEYQMLEAMLLPSADNIADSLAAWAFGSLANYQTYANQFLASHGLTDTHVGSDASGLNPSTTSTASNLVSIGQLVMSSPILSVIVAKPFVSGFPVVSVIHNYDSLLGQANIVGIKTGNTDQAGGVFVSAAKITVNNRSLMVYTAVMSAPTLNQALSSSLALQETVQAGFGVPDSINSIQPGVPVTRYRVAWNKSYVEVDAVKAINFSAFGDTSLNETITLRSINSKTATGQNVGTISVSSKLLNESASSPLILSQAAGSPSNWWVLLHPESFVHF